MADRSDFEPDRSYKYTDDIPGVDGDLLADLYDCTAKFGLPHQSPQMRRLSREGPIPLHVAVVVDPPGCHNMMVSRSPYGYSRTRIYTMLLSDPYPSALVWEKDIAAEEVRALIEETDAPMRELGLIDPMSGERTKLLREDDTAIYRVDEVFKRPGTVILVPEGMTAESMSEQFDRPDELHLVVTNRGAIGFVHSKDTTTVNLADAMTETAERMGISDPLELDRLPKAQRDHLIAEAVRKAYGKNN